MKKRILLAALAAPLASSLAHAAPQATTNLNVSANVVASCTISSTNLAFGNLSTNVAANVDVAAALTINCPTGQAYAITMGNGAGVGATAAVRRMTRTSGTETINYAIYRDAGRTQTWGSTIGTDTLASTGTGANQTVQVYGRVPTQSGLTAGAHTDVVVVNIDY
jgi:spore coat protein U-like protein